MTTHDKAIEAAFAAFMDDKVVRLAKSGGLDGQEFVECFFRPRIERAIAAYEKAKWEDAFKDLTKDRKP